MYLEMSSAPSPDSPHSLSPEIPTSCSQIIVATMTPTFIYIWEATILSKQILSHIFLWQPQNHAWQNLLTKPLQMHKEKVVFQNTSFYNFVFTVSRRMHWVSKHPLAIQPDEEQPAGRPAAAGHWAPQKREKPLLACVSPTRQRGCICCLLV